MCRIAGIVSLADRERRVRMMTDSMANGGPDDHGMYTSGTVTLGHRRLSIIDLSAAGHQPMLDAEQETVICYNGEIYNYRELKGELEKSGLQFRTSTDTEVIVKVYRLWGAKSFERLAGMFAFALLDKKKEKLFLVRDAGGIKPLYYSLRDGQVVFASEVKAFKACDPSWREDKSWRKLFLSFGFLPHPHTTLDGVRSLAPGSYLEVDVNSLLSKETNFTTQSNGSPAGAGRNGDQTAQVRDAVEASVRRHLISDAPLGVFLSGGIDSSLLTLLAGRELGDQLRTVSINFNEAAQDEQPYQQIVLERTGQHNHQSSVVTEKMFWDAWSDIWTAMDQPSIDGVNSYFVSKAARQSGLKAVLSGLGADELFGGYDSFRRISWIKYLRSLPAKGLIAQMVGSKKDPLRRLAFLQIPGAIGDYLFLRGLHTPDSVARILQCDEQEVWDLLKSLDKPITDGLDDLARASVLETQLYMRNQLLKDTDYMSMHFGLEVRVPFVDQDLMRTVNSIGLQNYYDVSRPKYLLTHSFEDILPSQIVDRKKQGFVFPFHVWLANGIKGGRNVISEKLSAQLETDRFLAGQSHWSKTWSGAVLENFRA